MTKSQITVGGKLYGYYTDENGNITHIRSESGFKTPYLKNGSAQFNKVAAEIKKTA